MTSRFLLRRSSALVRNRDGGLLSALRSELEHELSSKPQTSPQLDREGKLGSFVVDWNDANTLDTVLRRRQDSGEEIALSAVLGPLVDEGGNPLPRHVLMKVCMKKPGSEPILLFDCSVFRQDDAVEPEFLIHKVNYLDSSVTVGKSRYRGPSFSCLDPKLQDAFKEYLINRGISAQLNNFLLLYLQQKEQDQYVYWLQRLNNFFKK
ncbi:mitochondrial glycoprotein family protein [Wolffia australiana]